MMLQWEDITGGQAAQQGHAMLVSALREFCANAPSSIKPAEVRVCVVLYVNARTPGCLR
jgi:hypothetical protein